MSIALYVHVPFCASRCGYCDFNTYTAEELGGSVRRDTFHDTLIAEIRLAAQELPPSDRVVDSVFFGGGTPTLIGSAALNSVLDEVARSFTLEPQAEITTEANPDSVDQAMLDELLAGGFTRISFGMQSSAPHVLRVLERTHTPGAARDAVRMAHQAGFTHVNVDLIYGTPGESDQDVQRSVTDVLEAGVDHVSAYALIVEDGTALARRVARGDVPTPEDDAAADRYCIIDAMLTEAGLNWYEISNWARPAGECRHNLAYWRNQTWIGIGPGAHSHRDGTRWWNTKHPARYAEQVMAGHMPRADQEVLTAGQRRVEDIMLGIRVRDGLPAQDFAPEVVAALRDQGWVEVGERIQLTVAGRLLANRVIERLSEADLAGVT